MKHLAALVLAAGIAAPLAFAQPPDTGTPASVDDPVVRPDGPPTPADTAYENRVLGAFRSTQIEQGALDGRWRIATPAGQALYTLQLHDPGAGEARIEGAWSNVQANGPGGSGFIDSIWRDGSDVVFSFREGPAEAVTQLRLRPNGEGALLGEKLAGETRTGVLATRFEGVETAASAAPLPPPPAPVKAAPKPKAKAKAKSKSKTRRR